MSGCLYWVLSDLLFLAVSVVESSSRRCFSRCGGATLLSTSRLDEGWRRKALQPRATFEDTQRSRKPDGEDALQLQDYTKKKEEEGRGGRGACSVRRAIQTIRRGESSERMRGMEVRCSDDVREAVYVCRREGKSVGKQSSARPPSEPALWWKHLVEASERIVQDELEKICTCREIEAGEGGEGEMRYLFVVSCEESTSEAERGTETR